jgi:hypothetical protein
MDKNSQSVVEAKVIWIIVVELARLNPPFVESVDIHGSSDTNETQAIEYAANILLHHLMFASLQLL